MSKFLSSLFYGDYNPTPALTKKQAELSKQLSSCYDAVERWLGPDFLEQLEELQGEIHGISLENTFAEGFRFGAQLMLEALTPPSAPN